MRRLFLGAAASVLAAVLTLGAVDAHGGFAGGISGGMPSFGGSMPAFGGGFPQGFHGEAPQAFHGGFPQSFRGGFPDRDHDAFHDRDDFRFHDHDRDDRRFVFRGVIFHPFFFFGARVFAPVPIALFPPIAYPAYVYAPVAGYPSCYRYATTALINGVRQPAWGVACLQPDGSWRMTY